MRSALLSLILIGVVGGLMGHGLYAHFTDTEVSQNNTFQAWADDCEIDINGTYYNGDPFPLLGHSVIADIKPCTGETKTISLHLTPSSTNPVNVTLILTVIEDNGNGLVEPEVAAGDTSDGADQGELKDFLWMVIWEDANHDGIVDPLETIHWQGYAKELGNVGDQLSIPIGQLDLDPAVRWVGIKWHFDQNNGPWSGQDSPWGPGYDSHNDAPPGGNLGGENVNIAMTDGWGFRLTVATETIIP